MSDKQNLTREEITQIVKEGYDQVAETFIANIADRLNIYRMDAMFYWCKNVPNKEVLELGCGDCFNTAQIIIENGLNFFGVELSDTHVNMAKKNLPEEFKDRVVQGEMNKFCENAKNGSYGGVVAMFAFCHLPPGKQVDLFEQIHRILAEDGLLLFNTSSYIGHEQTFEGEPKRYGLMPDFCGKPSYDATFPSDWYELTLKYLGFELKMKQTIRDSQKFEGAELTNTYLVFRKMKICTKQ